MSLKLILFLCAVWQASLAIQIFNIGTSNVRTLSKTDDGTHPVNLQGDGFPYFGKYYKTLHVGMNGIVSLGNAVNAYDTRGWPTGAYSIGTPAIMPFWTDVNGYFTGKVFDRHATVDELNNFGNIITTNRKDITNINLTFGLLFEWKDITPCGCYFPKNTVQLALVTDGCSSYAILGYPQVNWGNDQGARVGHIRIIPQSSIEIDESKTRTLQSLVNGRYSMYFGGENMCTGHSAGTFLTDPSNSSIYYECGKCSLVNTITCPPGKKYDDQCQDCVTNSYPHCDKTVNGSWSAWTDSTQCSETCGPSGTKIQIRSCTNPAPKNGGSQCPGHDIISNSRRTVSCNTDINCPIDGGYGDWINNTQCTTSCGGGTRRQIRHCNNPTPQFKGRTCQEQNLGLAERVISCNDDNCPDPFCADKAPGDYSMWEGQLNASCSHKYYRCDSKRQLLEMSCTVTSTGVYFNANSKTCVSGSAPVSCPNYDCIGRINGRYNRNDDFCRAYLSCSNFVERIVTCPEDTPYYDNNTKLCVKGTGHNGNDPPDASCVDPDCQGKADGTYVIDDTCQGFYKCSNQRQTQWPLCGVREYYNVATQSCSIFYPTHGQCQHKFCRTNSNNVSGFYQITGSNCLVSYSQCSGPAGKNGVPNVLTTFNCPDGKYFQVLNTTTFAGECKDAPAPKICANWQCIGRNNGYREPFTGVQHSCTSYFECQNGMFTIQDCPNGEYFNPTTLVCSSSDFNENRCQHPECLPGGRQGGVGVYPILQGSQCGHSYYECDENLHRKVRGCPISLSGNYFGQGSNQAWSCLTGKSPAKCSNRDCVGRTPTTSQSPLYRDESDSYCRRYYSCPATNAQSNYSSCPNNGYLEFSSYTCVSGFPTTQNCRVDGGFSSWSSWTYPAGSSCSETCGTHGFQLQERTRTCTNPSPLNGGSTCAGASIEYRNATCRDTLPACGHTFCQTRAAGLYSKSMLIDPNTNNACYREYFNCSGSPSNTLTTLKCMDADHVFDPTQRSCVKATDINCPVCAGKADGFYAQSTTSHDCRQFMNCTNEYSITMTCEKISFNGEERDTYFNPTSKQCERLPSSICSPVRGFWSSWVSDGQACFIQANGSCQSREIRSCNDPAPVNDQSCSGDNQQFLSCSLCGDAFCIGRPAGSYSKSLLLNSTLNIACFAEYYVCSGSATNNKLTISSCTDLNYIFDPAVITNNGCRQGAADVKCPNTKCAAKADGLYDFSVSTHDCRTYINCTDELSTVVTCNSVNGSLTYFNKDNKKCDFLPRNPQICNFVKGVWSAWTNLDATCVYRNDQCVLRQQRTCTNPSPINDPNPCGGSNIQQQESPCNTCPKLCSSPLVNPCTDPNAVCTATDASPGYTCTCPTGYTSIGTGASIVCNMTTCAGKASGSRVFDPTSKRHYLLCDGNDGSTRQSCPNAKISIGIFALNDILIGNGVWFHPAFLTCVNTTNNELPPADPVIVNGQIDLNKACSDLADVPIFGGGTESVKLPMDLPSLPTCKYWLTCLNQKLLNKSLNPPTAGSCDSNVYDRDQRTCLSARQVTCPTS